MTLPRSTSTSMSEAESPSTDTADLHFFKSLSWNVPTLSTHTLIPFDPRSTPTHSMFPSTMLRLPRAVWNVSRSLGSINRCNILKHTQKDLYTRLWIIFYVLTYLLTFSHVFQISDPVYSAALIVLLPAVPVSSHAPQLLLRVPAFARASADSERALAVSGRASADGVPRLTLGVPRIDRVSFSFGFHVFMC